MLTLWFYFTFLALLSGAIGQLVARCLQLSSTTIVDRVWLGMAGITLVAGIWSIFLALDLWFIAVLTVVALIVWIGILRKSARNYRKWYYSRPILWTYSIVVLVLATGTLSGYVLDNDSYYLQTIKWLNTHGLVPGIANWHVFLAQQSGFHILEAALNLEFLQLGFNDVGLFLTLLMGIWAITPCKEAESGLQKSFRHLSHLILPVLLLLGTSPSPDVPVILIHIYVIYKFLGLQPTAVKDQLIIITILVSLACFFKITSIFLAGIPLFIFITWKKRILNIVLKAAVAPILFALLFLAKNGIASGYLLFPLSFLALDVDWLLPKSMLDFYTSATTAQAYGKQALDLQHTSVWQRLHLWLFQPGVEGWINKGIALTSSLAAVTIFIIKKPNIRWVLALYLTMAMVLFTTSPQARFFLPLLFPVFVILVLQLGNWLHNYTWVIARIGITSGAVLLIAPTVVSEVTDNKRMKAIPTFQWSNLLYPGPKSRFETAFAKAKINNVPYHKPVNQDFFYGTYDLPLPAAQEEYLKYFKTYYFVSPEYRGDHPKSGFRASSNYKSSTKVNP